MSLTSFTDNNDWLERSFALVDDDADAEHQPRKPIDLLW
jgi:hypothetical protein